MNLSKGKSKFIYLTSVVLTILLVFSVAVSMLNNNQAAEGAVISNADTISKDLLMSNKATRGSNVGDPVFDGNALSELYEKLAGTGATFSTVEVEARITKPTYSDSNVISIHSGMDSQDIRTANNNHNLVVKLDGTEWIVTALTTKDNGSTSDVILTLMLKDVAYDTKWAIWQPASIHDYSADIPATMYSASYLRAGLLNGATQYSVSGGVSATTLTAAEKTVLYGTGGYPFAIYTDNTETGNITNFLVKPNEVLYQQHENLYDVMKNSNQPNTWPCAPNDSSKYDIQSDKWNTNGGAIAMQSKNGYYDWGNDLIWVPSLAETGQNSRPTIKAGGGLWNLDSSQRGVSAGKCAWLRSANATSGGGNTNFIDANGTHGSVSATTSYAPNNTDETVGGTFAVRPALHLNLTAAEESTLPKLTPANVEVEYTGKELDLDFAKQVGAANWWTNSFKSRVNVEYYKNEVLEKPKEPYDSYTVKLTLKDAEIDSWADGTTEVKTIQYKVIKRKLPFPKWDTTDGGEKPFRGSAGVTFDLYYDGDFLSNLHTLTGKDYFDLVDVSTPTEVVKQSGGWKYKVIDAKKYDLAFTLKDTARYEWAKGAPSNGKLPFEVTKKIINVTLTADDGITDSLTGREGSSVNAILTIPPNQIEVGYDAKITISAQRLHAAPSDVSSEITLSDTSGTENITLDLSDVSANSDLYNLSIDCSSDEYEFVVTNTPTLKVEEDNKNVLRWQLYVGGKAQVGYYIDCDIDDTTKTVTFDKKTIYYTGKYAEFKASATPMGYSLKTTSYNGGYEMNTTDPTSTNTKKGINADDYTTIVDVYKNDDTSVVVTFKINWTIAPALFDMSGVKWLNNGDLPYDGGLAVSAKLDPTTIPKGLVVTDADYSTNQGANVGDSGTASVVFALDPAYDGNYVLPVKPDPTDPNAAVTYTGTFNWDQPWQVVPRTISTASWQSVNHPDSGKNFNILQLKDPAANTIVD
ncbi:MAG: hypothetical protein K2M75_05185, partial [Clostridia bacterium]|nr:hypothetical protein [Clostridia bacterium]